jgi:5-hydroxyisourate hydrolase
MGYLTTHVLDTARGCPGANMVVRLYRVANNQYQLLTETVTNSDGRCDAPLLAAEDFQVGTYQLVFEAGSYFRRNGVETEATPFVDEVILRFGVSHAEDHYHVPLLVSPYSYSTYRGS